MFGGGITMEKAGLDESGFATKSPLSSQRWYHFGSTDFGSYRLGRSAIAFNHPKARQVCKHNGRHPCQTRSSDAPAGWEKPAVARRRCRNRKRQWAARHSCSGKVSGIGGLTVVKAL